MPEKMVKALAYAVLIWIIGFVWGSVVFMTPALRSVGPIPHISRYPAISFPVLVIWVLISYLLARSYLKTATDKAGEGLKLGLTFALVSLTLDFLILVVWFKNGLRFFAFLTVWLAFLILLLVPWFVGRSLANTSRP